MKRPASRSGVGASSILLIIVVLCLTSFSVLTLLSAKVDLSLTQRTVETVSAYYQLDGAAQRRISEIDAALLAGGDPSGWADVTIEADQPQLISFTVSGTDGRALSVTLRLTGATEGPRYVITAYRLVNTEGWGAEPAPDLLTIPE